MIWWLSGDLRWTSKEWEARGTTLLWRDFFSQNLTKFLSSFLGRSPSVSDSWNKRATTAKQAKSLLHNKWLFSRRKSFANALLGKGNSSYLAFSRPPISPNWEGYIYSNPWSQIQEIEGKEEQKELYH